MVRILASGNAWVAEIPKLPAQIASNPEISTNFADIESKAPATRTKDLEFNRFFKLGVNSISILN
jgi:hypothetical protein